MAIRKDTIRQQFAEAIGPILEPGEQVATGAYTVSGPSPWLSGVLGFIGMLLLGMRYYFMAVTDRRVVFMKASMWTARPKGLAFADPRSAVSISDVDVSALWSHLKYRRPEGKQIRLNFHRMWREEMQAIVQAMSAPAAQPPAVQPPAVQPPSAPSPPA